MAPNSKKTMMDINSQEQNLLGNQMLPKSGGFLYFGGHFGFKMAAIANQNGRHMEQYVLLSVTIYSYWNLFILKF